MASKIPKMPTIPSLNDPSLRAAARRAGAVEMLRDGRRNRASTFTPAKGKGSYNRRTKYGTIGD